MLGEQDGDVIRASQGERESVSCTDRREHIGVCKDEGYGAGTVAPGGGEEGVNPWRVEQGEA